MGDRRRALYVQHEPEVGPGLVAEWAQLRDIVLDAHDPADPAGFPDPAGFDLLVCGGSRESAYDDRVPWLPAELAWLRHTVDAGVPVLGICFGAQLLARALGGEVGPAAVPEIGWLPVRSRAPAVVGNGPWLQWHHDAFTLPAGAALLADRPSGPQAFTWGPHVGVQFHPEATAGIVSAWAFAPTSDLASQGLDAATLVAESSARVSAVRPAALRLFDGFLGGAPSTLPTEMSSGARRLLFVAQRQGPRDQQNLHG